VTADEALVKLAESTGEAVAQVLEVVSQATVERSQVAVVPQGQPPLRSIPVPAVAASVSYIDGVTGGNIFVMTRLGVQRLAAAMMGMDADAVEEAEELTELDLSAAGEAMNQMMAAAAAATSAVLRDEVEIGPPETRFFATPSEATDAYELTPHVTSVGFTLLGEPCRLIQLVPNAFVVRMTRALDELAAQEAAGSVDRDKSPDDPVDLYVNGRRFATGRLLLVEDEWAVRIEDVLPAGSPEHHQSRGGTL
jgi:flagellar motor switch protein FliN/FliY